MAVRFLIALLLICSGISAQVFQTNSSPTKFRGLKADSILIIPSAADTVHVSNPKWGQPSIGSIFYKTSDSTFWIRSETKWNKVTVDLSGKLNISDTAAMMANAIRLIYRSADSVYYTNASGAHFAFIDSTGGSETAYVDSIYSHGGDVTDSIYYSKDGSEYLVTVIDVANGLIHGGQVTWTGTGYDFFVSSAIYRINGQRYTSNDTTLTLTASDPTNPRIDLFYVNTSGVATFLTGTPATNPITPQIDPDTDVALTSIYVPAASTSPTVDTTTVYDEATVSEWTGTGVGVTINTTNSTNVYRGVRSTDVGTLTNGDVIKYVAASPVNVASKQSLAFFVKLKSTWLLRHNLRVQLYNGGVAQGNIINIPLNKSSTSYQAFSISMASFALVNTTIDEVRFSFATTTGSVTGAYLDWVYFQQGIDPTPSTDYVQLIQRSGDSVQQRINETWQYAFTLSDKVDTTSAVYAGDGLVGGGLLKNNPSLRVDTLQVANKIWVSDRLLDKVNISDTSSMLSPYIRFANYPLLKTSQTVIADTGRTASALATGGALTKVADSLAAMIGVKIGLSSLSATTPLNYNSGTGAFSIQQANTSQSGFLSSTDWNTFNGKMTNPMTTSGDLIYGGASGTPTRLAAGTNGHVLTLAAGVPTWAAGGGGGLPSDSLAVRRVGASLQHIVSFNTTSNGGLYRGSSAASDSVNIFLGKAAGQVSGSSGYWNITMGNRTGAALTTGYSNILFGRGSGKSITTGYFNVSIGDSALTSVTTSFGNVTIGANAGRRLNSDVTTTTAGPVLAIGTNALQSFLAHPSAEYTNTAIGYNALSTNVYAAGNTAVGYKTLESAVKFGYTYTGNTAIGDKAGNAITSGEGNTAIGAGAFLRPTTASNNTAIGYGALAGLAGQVGGSGNTAIGYGVLGNLSTGTNNIVIGTNSQSNLFAGIYISSGSRNIIMSTFQAGQITTGAYNILIGDQPFVTSATDNGQISLGNRFNVNSSGQTHIQTSTSIPTVASTFTTGLAFDVGGSTTGAARLQPVTTAQRNSITGVANAFISNTELDIDNDHNGTTWTVNDGTIFTQTADKNINTTAAETTLFGTGSGTLTIPASYLYSGNTITIKIQGYMTTNGTPTLDIKFKLGSTTIASTGAVTLVSVGSNGYFEAECTLTARASPSAASAISGQGYFTYHDTQTTANHVSAMTTATVNAATNGSLAVDVTATWGTSDASNKIVSTNAIVEIKN